METKIELARELSSYLEDYVPNVEKTIGVYCRLDHCKQDGRGLLITEDHNKYYAGCCWHQSDRFYVRGDLKVGTSKCRGLEAFAKAIRNRLLPRYHVEYFETKVEFERIEREQREEQSLLELIVRDKLGSNFVEGQDNVRRIYRHGVQSVSVLGGDVKIETTYIPKEVALLLLEILKSKVE